MMFLADCNLDLTSKMGRLLSGIFASDGKIDPAYYIRLQNQTSC